MDNNLLKTLVKDWLLAGNMDNGDDHFAVIANKAGVSRDDAKKAVYEMMYNEDIKRRPLVRLLDYNRELAIELSKELKRVTGKTVAQILSEADKRIEARKASK